LTHKINYRVRNVELHRVDALQAIEVRLASERILPAAKASETAKTDVNYIDWALVVAGSSAPSSQLQTKVSICSFLDFQEQELEPGNKNMRSLNNINVRVLAHDLYWL
jgi:hypothetical protein